MGEPIGSGETIKELLKDPQLYVIAVIVGVGGYLMKGSTGRTWYAGAFLICIGIVFFIAKFLQSLLDSSFKRKYTEVISAQSSAMRSQRSVISELSKNTIAAHATMATPTKLSGAGDYKIDDTDVTSVK